MTPERAAALVARWARRYTRDLPAVIAERRVAEIEADLHDQIAHDRALGVADRRIVLGLLSRMTRGVPADLAWRHDHIRATTARRPTTGGPMLSDQTAYRLGLVLALGSGLFLLWGVAAMGIVGTEGDRFDLLYLGVLAVGLTGAIVVRLRPAGLVRVLLAMAAAIGAITVLALVIGKQTSPVSSVAEIVGLNGLFGLLFLGAAWLVRRGVGRPATP